MASRPLTIREIQEQKRLKREAEQNKVRVTNLRSNQSIPIQIYGKNSKLAVHQITIQIPPKGHVDIPEVRLIEAQIVNLRKRGMIRAAKVGANSKEMGYKDFLGKLPKAKKEKVVNKKSSSKKKSKESND